LADLLRIPFEAQEHRQNLLAQVVLVDFEKQIRMSPVIHEVPDAFIHGDASGWHQPRHTRNDRVETGAHHVRAATQHRDHLEHVVVVADELWRRSAKTVREGLARFAIDSLHAYQDRKNVSVARESLYPLRD